MNDFRCDDCGHFVPYADLDCGAAVHVMVTPDSAYTSETYKTLCRKCLAAEQERKASNAPQNPSGRSRGISP